MAVTPERMSLAEFLELPETKPARELIGHGVRVAVLVAPIQKTVYVIRANGEAGPLHGDDTVNVNDVLPEVRVTVADFLARVRPRPRHRPS